MAENEFLTACRFYFEASGIQEKVIKEISGLGAESTPTQEAHGVSKGGRLTRQVAPSLVKFTNITIKVIATRDKDLYDWFSACNKNYNEGSSWAANRMEASVTAYDQGGAQQARWEILNTYPCKYVGPTLTASSGDMANETIELVHEGIRRVL